MSRRIYAHCRHEITSTFSISPTPRSCRALFSQFTKPQQNSPIPPGHNDRLPPPNPVNANPNGHRPPRQRRLHLPAFAPFLLALPLGWYLSSLYPSSSTRAPADPTTFTSYTLVSRDTISSTLSIFRLQPAPGAAAALDLDNPSLARALTSVQLKQPQLQIARAYTVLPHADGQPIHELRLLIRREERGEVSGYLHSLPVGAAVEVRGPRAEFEIPEGVGGVVFIAGGTGIAPALQVGDLLFGEDDEGRGREVDLRVLWASRVRGDCRGGRSDLVEAVRKGWGWWGENRGEERDAVQMGGESEKGEIIQRLDQMKGEAALSGQERSRLRVGYFVDEESTPIRPADVRRVMREIDDKGSAVTKKLVFVSGPEGFVNYWAGPKQWINGREEQGPLGGVLAKLDIQGWEVVKL